MISLGAPPSRTGQLGNQGIVSRGGGGPGCASVGVGCAKGGATWTNGCGGGATRSRTFTGFGFRVGRGLFEKKEWFSGGASTLIKTVCDTKPSFAKITDWLSTGNAKEQGVRHV